MSTFIAAVMIVGGREEPFLAPCLESIARAVDLLVINDNSQEPSSVNRGILKESSLYREGKVHVIPSGFKGFGYCRTLCLDYLRENFREGMWVLYIDSDEVHSPAVISITRGIIPCLSRQIGIVDGYFYNFYQSPRWFISLDRRHNLFFRFNKDVRWEGEVHEKPVNLQGRREAIPYRYFHYGYLKTPADIVDRWKLYGTLGDEQSGTQGSAVDYSVDAARSLPFRGRHPDVAKPYLEKMEEINRAHIAFYEKLVREKTKFGGTDKACKNFNFELRMAFRAIQFLLRSLPERRLRKGFLEMMGGGPGNIT